MTLLRTCCEVRICYFMFYDYVIDKQKIAYLVDVRNTMLIARPLACPSSFHIIILICLPAFKAKYVSVCLPNFLTWFPQFISIRHSKFMALKLLEWYFHLYTFI